MIIAIAIVMLVLAGIALVAGEEHMIAGLPASDLAMLVTVAGLLLITASLLAGSARGRWRGALRDIGVWTLIAITLVAGYSYRTEILSLGYRVAGELTPPGDTITVDGRSAGERAVRIRRRPDGHFFAKTVVNGTQLQMLVDTGASSIVLKQADAERAGINVRQLAFTIPVQTANGTTFAAPVRLDAITVGAIGFRNLEALVAKPGALKDSLLGMGFLNRLRSYEFAGEFLTLRI